jgi:chemotaxis family two-component system sensor kinase Cph1
MPFRPSIVRHQSAPPVDRPYISYMISGAKRMYALIESLLEYSQSGVEFEREPTDCGAVMEQVLENLRTLISETRATVRCSSLPSVQSNSSMLVHLFQNLISNALKFSGDSPPSISVFAQRKNRDWTFTVEDHGIGIERQYFDKIFLLFRRDGTNRNSPQAQGSD